MNLRKLLRSFSKNTRFVRAIVGFMITASSVWGMEKEDDSFAPPKTNAKAGGGLASADNQEVRIEDLTYEEALDKFVYDKELVANRKIIAHMGEYSRYTEMYSQEGDIAAISNMIPLSVAVRGSSNWDYYPEEFRTPGGRRLYWIEKLEERANSGNVAAQRKAGDIFSCFAPLKDLERALLYYRMAADQGDEEALQRLHTLR